MKHQKDQRIKRNNIEDEDKNYYHNNVSSPQHLLETTNHGLLTGATNNEQNIKLTFPASPLN